MVDKKIVLEKKIEDIRKQLKVAERELTKHLRKLSKIKIRDLKEKLNDDKTDIKYLIEYDNLTEEYAYGEVEKLLNRLGFEYAGVNFKTNQIVPRIKIKKNFDDNYLKIIAKSITFIKKYMKEISGCKTFDIFENSLGQRGVFCLKIKNKKYLITNTYSSTTKILSEHKTPYEALKEIRKEYYYE